MEQLNGFELAGRSIRLNTVENDEETDTNNGNFYTQFVPEQKQTLDTEDDRLELMARLTEGYYYYNKKLNFDIYFF